jgi:hypothetical protein
MLADADLQRDVTYELHWDAGIAAPNSSVTAQARSP